MILYTIGFTKKNAEEFFTLLKQPGLVRLLDIRLKNVSQFAGFTKRDDLRFFLKEINGIDYLHMTELAPTKDILDASKKNKDDWATYERQFLALMKERKIADTVEKSVIDGGCLLCTEATPEHCHRRLVAEHLRSRWGNLEIRHL
jgi:uncharacterized protein (DUF488 family)